MRHVYICSTADNGSTRKRFLKKTYNTSAADPPSVGLIVPLGCLMDSYGDLENGVVIDVLRDGDESVSIVIGHEQPMEKLCHYYVAANGWCESPEPT